jgi:GT2 family glycosyltransferase
MPLRAPTPKVSIILLNLNGYEDTRDCLESLRQVEHANFEIILVDNGSSDDSAARLRTEFPEIRLISTQENQGFSGGNNLGIRDALERGTDYILLLNNDTIVDSHFLAHLVTAGEMESEIGILGPKIFYASEPERIWFAGGELDYVGGGCRHRGKGQFDSDDKFSRSEETAFISGCAMLVKAWVFQRLGLLDEKLFIYWEDMDFCMRARKAGCRCFFVPEAKIWHKVSRTCGVQSRFTLYLSTRNQLNWVTEHVPYPYKLCALFLTFLKKFRLICLFAPKNRQAAAAVWEGMQAYLWGVYGPPPKGKPPGRQLPVSQVEHR